MPIDHALSSLFDADRVAIIGASDRSQYASTMFRNLQQLGFDTSRVIPVNPNRPEVFGLKAYPSVLDVPGDLPVAVVATAAQLTPSIVRQLGEKKVRGAVVLADGFSESGEEGKALQQKLIAEAREAGVQVVGPNCMGFVSMKKGLALWAGALPKSLRPGNIACVFQSSGMLNLFFTLLGRRKMGIHVAVSGGNEAVLSTPDFLTYAVDCPEVRVISMFMEAAAKDPEKFVRALDAAVEGGKRVVILRAGRTERAKKNVIAHTGNLAGSAAAWDALLDQHGAILVHDLDDLLETTVLFASTSVRPDPHELGVGLITISGGDCTLLCDIAEQESVPLPELSPDTHRTMMEKLEKPTLLGNPLDVENLQRQNETSFHHCLDAFFQEPRIDTVGVRLNLPDTPTPTWSGVYERIATLGRQQGKRVVVLSRASEPLSEQWYELFRRLDVPFVQEYRKGLRALQRLRKSERELEHGRFAAPARPDIPKASATDGSGILSFTATAGLLKHYGIPLSPWKCAGSVTGAVRAAEEMGYPCVLKIASPDIPHKTEFGGLAVGLKNSDEVEKSYQEILARVGERAPQARIEGVLVQPMLRGAECLLGITRDPQLGPVLAVGLGGIWVEVIRDVAVRVAPISAAEARRAIEGLRGLSVLQGVRGAPQADMEAFCEMASRLSWLAYDLRDEIMEIDLNPVLVLPAGEGAAAVDALIVTKYS